jgi:hypothetical protein
MKIKSRFELSAVESNTLLTLSAIGLHLSQIDGAGRDDRFAPGVSVRRDRRRPPPATGWTHAAPSMNGQDKPRQTKTNRDTPPRV